jgi:2'-5' RNA ligase
MASRKTVAPLLPGLDEPKFEYYPILLPDDATLQRFANLNEVYVQTMQLTRGQLVKRAHISLDGKITTEDDEGVISKIAEVAVNANPIDIQFGDVQQFPYWKNIIVYLSIQNHDKILQLNALLMERLMAKTTRLKLHLTLARDVSPDLLARFAEPGLNLPATCVLDKIAILKKPFKIRAPYKTIAIVPIGAKIDAGQVN